jgi:hypothetical protein
LSLIEIAALRFPLAAGVKATLTKQLAPEARLDPHVVLIGEKSAVLAPVTEMLVMATDAFPLLVIVSFLGRLFVPTGWFPKFTLEGETAIYVPVPVNATF